MATSGSYSTSHIAATSKKWYWDVSWWVSSWSGNTATISYEVYDRCETGTSGITWVSNYGFGGSIAGHNFDNVQSGNFVKDKKRAWGSFTISGGSGISSSCWARPYGSSGYYSDGSGSWTLDNNVVTPTVTVSLGTPTETGIPASMSVTNNGNASIVDNYIDLFTDSGCTNKVGTITGTSGTFTKLSPNKTYYAKANASNGTYRGYSGVASKTTYDYPHVTTTPNFKIRNKVSLTLYNPLKRNCTCTMYGDDWSIIYSGNGWTGTSISDFASQGIINKLYASIPNKQTGTYHIKITYDGVDRDKVNAGTYSVQGDEKPTFTDFNYKDTDGLASYLTGKNGKTNPGILVAGLSDCIFSIPTSKKATSDYGAALDKYNFSWPNGAGTSSAYSNSAEISNHVYDGNTKTISVTAYDKRGQYKTVSKSITLISPSHATGSLRAARSNGVDTTVYLNGSLSYWAGDWAAGSSRPNTIYKIEYRINKTGSYYNIYSSINSNKTASTSNNRTTWTLGSNKVELHANGSSGGFPIGSTYTVEIFVSAGQKFNNTEYYFDNRQLVNTFTISSGAFGLTRYKASSGEYCYGINRLPDPSGNAPWWVRGNDIQMRAESSVSDAVMGYGIGNGGVNRGIYDHSPGRNKWMVYYDGTQTIINDPLKVNGVISSSQKTDLFINGNKGLQVIINSTASAGFTMIARQKSTNGVFMFGTYNNSFRLFYTADSVINAGTNSVTKDMTLMNENGDMMIPEDIYIKQSRLSVSGNAPSATVRAWCKGSASSSGATINGGMNIASVARQSTGSYKVNFSAAMPSANYSAQVSCEVDGMGQEIIGVYDGQTTYFKFDCCSPNGTPLDPSQFRISVVC